MAALRGCSRLFITNFTRRNCQLISPGLVTLPHYTKKQHATVSRAQRFCTEAVNEEIASRKDGEDLKLSDSCVKQLKKLGEDGGLLRVVVEGGGCSGFQYKFELDKEITEEDRLFERDGARIVVDDISLDLIKGSTIDYEIELIRSAFVVINNPKADSGCSCGVSFSLKI